MPKPSSSSSRPRHSSSKHSPASSPHKSPRRSQSHRTSQGSSSSKRWGRGNSSSRHLPNSDSEDGESDGDHEVIVIRTSKYHRKDEAGQRSDSDEPEIIEDDEDEDDEDEPVYEVEKILDHRMYKNKGKFEYLVKWVGYDDPSDNTWEPEVSTLPECLRWSNCILLMLSPPA